MRDGARECGRVRESAGECDRVRESASERKTTKRKRYAYAAAAAVVDRGSVAQNDPEKPTSCSKRTAAERRARCFTIPGAIVAVAVAAGSRSRARSKYFRSLRITVRYASPSIPRRPDLAVDTAPRASALGTIFFFIIIFGPVRNLRKKKKKSF